MPILETWQRREEARRLYWWQPDNGSINVGDDLARVVVTSMLALHDRLLLQKKNTRHRLFAIGSVLHNAKNGDVVWGSGVNGKVAADAHTFRALDVRAVRGPLTRALLMERGLQVPSIFGDPALLMPAFYPRALLGVTTRRPYVVVPHFNEPVHKYTAHKDCLVLPTMKPLTFVRQLLEAEFVVSSSLHGVILAEAYGVPAVYLDSDNGENQFKYDDYYQGTGRPAWHAGKTVEECLSLGGNAAFDVEGIGKGLMDAFPYDLWP